MKNLIFISFFLFIVSIRSFSNTNSSERVNFEKFDEDISKLLEYEINQARNSAQASVISSENFDEFIEKDNGAFISLLRNKIAVAIVFAILESLCVGFLIVQLVNRSKKFEKEKNRELKKNIAALRDEKLAGLVVEKKLSQIGKIAEENLNLFNFNPDEVAEKAKRMSASKGELLLAMKIKAFEADKKCSEAL